MCLSQSRISILRLLSSVFYSVCFSQTHNRRNSGAKISFSFHFKNTYRSVLQPPRDDFRALHPKISTKICVYAKEENDQMWMCKSKTKFVQHSFVSCSLHSNHLGVCCCPHIDYWTPRAQILSMCWSPALFTSPHLVLETIKLFILCMRLECV